MKDESGTNSTKMGGEGEAGKISAENLYIFTSFVIFYNVQALSISIYATATALAPAPMSALVVVAAARRDLRSHTATLTAKI